MIDEYMLQYKGCKDFFKATNVHIHLCRTHLSSCHHECRLVLRYARIFVLFLVSFFKACSIPPIKTHYLNQDQNVILCYLIVRLIVLNIFKHKTYFFYLLSPYPHAKMICQLSCYEGIQCHAS